MRTSVPADILHYTVLAAAGEVGGHTLHSQAVEKVLPEVPEELEILTNLVVACIDISQRP